MHHHSALTPSSRPFAPTQDIKITDYYQPNPRSSGQSTNYSQLPSTPLPSTPARNIFQQDNNNSGQGLFQNAFSMNKPMASQETNVFGHSRLNQQSNIPLHSSLLNQGFSQLGQGQSSLGQGQSSLGQGQSSLGQGQSVLGQPSSPPQWRELPTKTYIRVRQDVLMKAKEQNQTTPPQVNHSISSIAYLENYLKVEMSTIQIRSFTYLQQMGVLQTWLQQGYAQEVQNKMARVKGAVQAFFYSDNRVVTSSSGSGQSVLGRPVLGQSVLGQPQPQQQSKSQGPFGQGQFSFGQSTLANNNSNTNNKYPINGQYPFLQGSNNVQSPFQKGSNTAQLPFGSKQPQFPQQQNPGIFTPSQIQPNVYLPTNQLQPVSYNPEVVEGMRGPLMDHIGRTLMSERTVPMMGQFLRSYGITEDILEYLFRMGLTQEEVKEFLLRRFLLRQLDQEKAKRMNFLSDFYLRGGPGGRPGGQGEGGPGGQGEGLVSNFSQDPSYFPHYARYPYQNDKFSRYVDYVLDSTKYSWEERVMQDSWRDHLKSNISSDYGRQQRIRQFLNDLEEIEQNGLVDEEFRRREQRIVTESGFGTDREDREESVAEREKEKDPRSGWMSVVEAESRGLNTVPMRVRPYYLE